MTKPLRILFVEGRRTVQRQFIEKLSAFHFQIDTVPGQHSAQTRSAAVNYALVVLGVELSQDDRLFLIQQLLERPHAPAILAFIPQHGESLAAETLHRGASDYLIQDEEGRFWDLVPMVVRNSLRRRQLEQEKLSMLHTLQKRNLALSSLNQVSNELTSLLDLERITTRLMRAAIDILNAEGGSLWLWEDNRCETVVCTAVIHRTDTPPLIGLRRRRGEGVVGWAAEHKRNVVLNQVSVDNRFSREIDIQINFMTDSLMAVPLRIHDRVIGVLEFVNKIEGQFDDDDLSLAETLAGSAATALENARLVEELRTHTIDLEERNEELNAFGFTLAHDLQNMLARVVGFAELLSLELADPQGGIHSREMLINAADLISRNSRKMSLIIDALLQLAAVRKLEVEFEPVAMDDVVYEVVDRLSDWIEKKDAILNISGDLPLAYGYAAWVEEVWFNYISNALKYGGQPPLIQVGAEIWGETNEACFWVRDNGPGIDPSLADELFRPFKRVSTNTEEGHGLGLSIVARIVKRMGGTAGVSNAKNAGAQFYFTLPLCETAPAHPLKAHSENDLVLQNL